MSHQPQRPLASLARNIALAAVTALLSLPALAADAFPTKPLTLVVPFPPDGTTDVYGRAAARGLTKQLGQEVVVENKAGAGGTVGAAAVAQAKPDGHTLLIGGPSDQINEPLLMSKPPYDPAKDFEPVGCVSRTANVLVVRSSLQAPSLEDVIKKAKAQPGKLRFASAGTGNSTHLLGELFAQSAGIDIVHVPFKSNAPALTDLLDGNVDMMFTIPVAVQQHVWSGTLRAVATTAATRLPNLPDVPTFRESKLPIEAYGWACVFVPAKTPVEILDKLHDALTRAIADPEATKWIEGSGAEKFQLSRDEAKRFLAAERSKWGSLIRSRNIRVD